MHDISPSDVALLLDLALAVALAGVFIFGTKGWTRDPLGWVIAYYALSVVALLFLIVWGIVFGGPIIEPIRLLVAASLAVALLWKTHAIITERRRGRRARERAASVADPEKEESKS